MEIFIDIVIAVKGHAVIVAGLRIVHRRARIVAAADKVKFFENDLCLPHAVTLKKSAVG